MRIPSVKQNNSVCSLRAVLHIFRSERPTSPKAQCGQAACRGSTLVFCSFSPHTCLAWSKWSVSAWRADGYIDGWIKVIHPFTFTFKVGKELIFLCTFDGCIRQIHRGLSDLDKVIEIVQKSGPSSPQTPALEFRPQRNQERSQVA